MKSRLTDVRYVHFDNDVYERTPDATAPGISDHDPPLATFELPRARARARRATSPATCPRRWR